MFTVPTLAPSKLRVPVDTVALPPGCQTVRTAHPLGSAVPEHSAPPGGWRMTSPSAACETEVFVPGVPPENSELVVSVRPGGGVSKLAGASPLGGEVAELSSASAELMR